MDDEPSPGKVIIVGLPNKEDDPEFKGLVTRTQSRTPIGPELNIPKADKINGVSSKRNLDAYASFGDQGTTASASAYGKLLRISGYLGGKESQSGMYSLDFSNADEAYFVTSRAENFQEACTDPKVGFGLRIKGDEYLEPETPNLAFLGDRWPRITYTVNGLSVTVQLLVNKGIVIQQFNVTNISESNAELEIVLDVDFVIQELQYMSWEGARPKSYQEGPHGHGAVFVTNSAEDQKCIGAVAGVFRNGESLILPKTEDNATVESIPILTHLSLEGNETLELTAAYRLQSINRESPWKEILLQSTDVDVNKVIEDTQTHLPEWPNLKNEILGWHLRRTLEHILSVCSIPVERCTDSHVTPVALTCGDFGDHRVSVPGSLFAFKVLLSMYKHMDEPQFRGSNLDSLRARVRETCKGHLQWVFKAEIGETGFDANYWVNGRIIKQDEGSSTALPSNSPANMPTQILKACEYLEVFQESADSSHVLKGLGPFVKAWLKLLNKTKNHLAMTWRHVSDSVIATFRLDDHVWIWKALDSIEKLLAKVEERQTSSPNPDLETFLKLKSHLASTGKHHTDIPADERWESTAAETRKQIFRRFTTENLNDVSKKRMLAVTRSAQETRFLFHSRDIALYYGLDWGFFADGPQTSSELWQNLVESQVLHDDENDELLWDNPLRYALSLRMGVEGHRIDKNYSPSEMVHHAQTILFKSSSANGLFPGQLDDTTKEGNLFDRERYRDFYFHAGFEIPHLLLWAAEREISRKIPVGDPKQYEGDDALGAPDRKVGFKISEPTVNPTLTQVPDRQPKRQILSANTLVSASPTANKVEQFPLPSDQREKTRKPSISLDRSGQNDGRPTVAPKPFKRRILFSKFVDLSNIVDMPEEWLYNYPKFLNFEHSYDDKTLRKAIEGVDGDNGRVIVEGAKISLTKAGLYVDPTTESDLKAELTDDSNRGPDTVPADLFHNEFTANICLRDVAKHKGKGRKNDESAESYGGHLDLWNRLSQRRTVEEAKKRIVFLGSVDCEAAMICWLASPDVEREHISQFFDRHSTSRGFFLDDTVSALNTWETEFHLTFYQLVEGELKRNELEREKHDQRPLIRSGNKGSFPSPKGKDFYIYEAAMGFRINGDFFDRYWTCYVIDDILQSNDPFGELIFYDYEHWQQRKVLELILLQRILANILDNAQRIIDEVEEKSGLGRNDLFGKPNSDDRNIEVLQEVLRVLFALKNNFASILENIDFWENRESVRGQERPRWTRNDEQKYRRSINRRLALCKRSISVLKTQQARIESLIPLVTSIQDGMRAEMSLHEAENIRLFTYVTVFYLPVGLASSILSMSQIPGRNLVVSMIVTAAVALIITFTVLYTLFFAGNLRITAKVRQFLDVVKHPKRWAKQHRGEHGILRSRVKESRTRMREYIRKKLPSVRGSEKPKTRDVDVESARAKKS